MKIKHQLSIATLVLAGVFATGCSQQQVEGGSQASGSQQVEGGSQQVEGGSQSSGSQQVEGGSQQVEGGSQAQQSGSQQVEEEKQTVKPPVVRPPVVRPPVVRPPVKHVNRWGHTHPAIPNCTDSIRHVHKYNTARHTHKYSCRNMVRRPAAKPPVNVRALQEKLKAKGYYKGPIDGIVGPATRSALQRFMQR